MDVGCGILIPLRHSGLCIVYQYDHHRGSRPCDVEDKAFEANGLVITTEGRWEYSGKRGSAVIRRGIAVIGEYGRHFGCRHDVLASDSNLIVALRPNALDGDEPSAFKDELVPIDGEAAVRLAMAKADINDFESCIFEVLDSFASCSGGLKSRPHGYMRMQRVKRFIERHALENISLADLANLVNMSSFSLLRQFKGHTGVTPHDYIMALRLIRARELLTANRLSIGDVSRNVGFQDQRYFSRWFQKATGLSPTAFRSGP
jgi:AraC family transcriptional regulator